MDNYPHQAETEEEEWLVLVNNAESDATKARAAKRRNFLDAAEAKGFYSKP